MAERLIGGLNDSLARGAPVQHPALLGFQILVVEDEILVSMMLEDILAEFGCVVAGVAASVAEALSEIGGNARIDAAILDVNLGGEKIFPVADLLSRMGVPLVFSTGYGPADLAQRYPGNWLLNKPYEPDALAEVLVEIARRPLH